MFQHFGFDITYFGPNLMFLRDVWVSVKIKYMPSIGILLTQNTPILATLVHGDASTVRQDEETKRQRETCCGKLAIRPDHPRRRLIEIKFCLRDLGETVLSFKFREYWLSGFRMYGDESRLSPLLWLDA